MVIVPTIHWHMLTYARAYRRLEEGVCVSLCLLSQSKCPIPPGFISREWIKYTFFLYVTLLYYSSLETSLCRFSSRIIIRRKKISSTSSFIKVQSFLQSIIINVSQTLRKNILLPKAF